MEINFSESSEKNKSLKFDYALITQTFNVLLCSNENNNQNIRYSTLLNI